MKISMLGTGSALVTELFNTCFTITSDDGKVMLIDGGGGNTLLSRLKEKNIDWKDIHDIFVTHKHIDHILGLIWLIRLVCQWAAEGNYDGVTRIYGNSEVVGILNRIAQDVLAKKHSAQLGKALQFVEVNDGDVHEIIGKKVRFFDIGSTKDAQMGFAMEHEGKANFLCCMGDEPYNEKTKSIVAGCTWMMHEAFCLIKEADIFHPYERHHSTVKDAACVAESLGVKNLILYHTEESHGKERKKLYTEEAKQHYNGALFIPDDLEDICL